jgi:hypothetical protein
MKLLNAVLLATLFISSPGIAQPTLSAEDRTAIQGLVTQYAQALGGCRAAEFAISSLRLEPSRAASEAAWLDGSG